MKASVWNEIFMGGFVSDSKSGGPERALEVEFADALGIERRGECGRAAVGFVRIGVPAFAKEVRAVTVVEIIDEESF